VRIGRRPEGRWEKVWIPRPTLPICSALCPQEPCRRLDPKFSRVPSRKQDD
jgi:hypothetical protein